MRNDWNLSTYTPKLDNILKGRSSNEQAVQRRVEEEQDEELVVAVADAVVHPWAMVVLFEKKNNSIVSQVKCNQSLNRDFVKAQIFLKHLWIELIYYR